MIQVDNFLMIFSLEVGGKFIGWFGLISSGVALPLCILILIGACIDKDLHFIREQLEVGMEIEIFNNTDERSTKQLREYLIFSSLLMIIILLIYLIASFLLLRGTINVRNFPSDWNIFVNFYLLLLGKSSPN